MGRGPGGCCQVLGRGGGCSIEEEKGEGSLRLFGTCPLASPWFDLQSYWLPQGWNPGRPSQWPLLSRAVLKVGALAWSSCQFQSAETTSNSVLPQTAALWSSFSLFPQNLGWAEEQEVGLARKAPSEPGKATGNPKLELGRTGGGDRPGMSVLLPQSQVSCEP